MLNNLKNMNILQMKEIIDKKIEINNKKKTHTPEKKGYDYYNNKLYQKYYDSDLRTRK